MCSLAGALAVLAVLLVMCSAAFASQAVAYQIDPAHTGFQSDGPFPPLTKRWSRDLGGPISYPLIAEGKVFVIVSNIGIYGTKLYALDELTGQTVWGPIEDKFANYYIAGLAYDAGRIFVVNYDGVVRAYSASSGSVPDRVAALDSLLQLRDPFPVFNGIDMYRSDADRNTRVVIFVNNLGLQPGETPSSVIVNLIDSKNQNYEIPAESVQSIPNVAFSQIVFRLPDTLSDGTCVVKVKARGQISNAGKMSIK